MDDLGIPEDQQADHWRNLSQQERDAAIKSFRDKHPAQQDGSRNLVMFHHDDVQITHFNDEPVSKPKYSVGDTMDERVRGNLTGPEIVTPREVESVVTVDLGPAVAPPKPAQEPTILVEVAQRLAAMTPAPPKGSPVPKSRLVLVDLSKSCNVTLEKLMATPFVFDYADGPQPLVSWWGNPAITMPPSPRVVETAEGLLFLTSGQPRPGLGKQPNHLLALSSWRPHPFPAAAVVSIGMKCRRVYLLLQSYVHPMKNYIPNGEVVLHYSDGRQSLESLVPPFNLDCYFQHFSLKGTPVPLGQLDAWPIGWSPIQQNASSAHADALEIACDPDQLLESVELRATCSEGVLGLAGMTLWAAEDVRPVSGAGQVSSAAQRRRKPLRADWW